MDDGSDRSTKAIPETTAINATPPIAANPARKIASPITGWESLPSARIRRTRAKESPKAGDAPRDRGSDRFETRLRRHRDRVNALGEEQLCLNLPRLQTERRPGRHHYQRDQHAGGQEHLGRALDRDHLPLDREH